MQLLHNCNFYYALCKTNNLCYSDSMIKESTPLTRWLRLIALLLFLATVGTWIYTGCHIGWTKTQVQEIQIEEVTEMEVVVIHDHFVAGIDFLGAGVGMALLLLLASLFLSRRYRNYLPESEDPICGSINNRLQ